MPNPLIMLIVGVLLLALASLLFWPRGGLLGYIQTQRQLTTRVLQEDALKHMHKSDRHGTKTSLESLSGALRISTNHAVTLLDEMQTGGLVQLDGEYFKLTQDGHKYALRIIRAHRLYERYLADETGFEESRWHNLAEQYEHQLSPAQADALSQKLGNPTHDPHGDPIPTQHGDLVSHGGKPVTSMPPNMPLQIVHIKDEPDTVYAQLAAEGLHPGMEISLLENTTRRVRIWADDGEEHLLAPVVANSLSVIQIQEQDYEIQCVGEPLHLLSQGQQGTVLQLSPRLRGAERRRMIDLGVLPGTTISAEMISPGGDPVAYRVRGALIALRHEQSDLIRITDISEGEK